MENQTRFDVVLPPQVREELTRPKLHPPRRMIKQSKPTKKPGIADYWFPCFLLLGFGGLISLFKPASDPTPKLDASSTAADMRWSEQPITPPRAQRVWPLGEWHEEWMPDGTWLRMRILGELGSFDELPKDPQLGDCWNIPASGAHWVWSIPKGWTHAAWVDP